MKILPHQFLQYICVLVICTATSIVFAAGENNPAINDEIAEEKPLWEMNLAAFARYGPAYPASEDSQINIIPLPFPVYRGRFLRIGDDTDKPVTTRIFRRDRIKLDIDFGLNFPVDSDDVDARTDMPDLDLLAEAGPELELQFVKGPKLGNAYLALQARGAFSFDGLDPTWRGLIFSSELRYVRPVNHARTEFMARITPEWAGNEYMDFFYGVAPEYATPERPEYRATGGYLGTKLAFSVKHKINDDFELRTGVRFGLYQGARNRDSALYTAETNSGIYIAFLWKFWESARMADTEPD
ncbi:MAG: MipA/OmpV family protein [Gammaproteobacteria bacterium]|nr:MAG: MipA/OmpV family protein [Gammaproteobacteria bacterium]